MAITLMRRSWAKLRLSAAAAFRLELAGDQTILGAQEGAHQRRRARIGGEPLRAIERGDRLQIGRQQGPAGRVKGAVRYGCMSRAMPSRHSPLRAASGPNRS